MNNSLTADELNVLMQVFADNDEVLIDDYSGVESVGSNEYTISDKEGLESYKFGTEVLS